MRFIQATAVALALAVGGLSAPISSPLTATDAEAAQKVVKKKRTVTRKNGNKRVVTNKRVVVRRPGVRVVGGRYWYGDRYYDHDTALAAGLIGFTAGAVVVGALAQQAEAGPVFVAPVVGVPAVYTDDWYDQCDEKYNSFDYESGTFLGYDGERYLCQLP